MARRIAVELSLDAQRYVSEARKVSAITNAVVVEVDDLDHQVDKAGRSMDELAAQTKVAGKEVGDLGGKATRTSAEMTVLDRRIASVRRSLAIMNLEFKATGDLALGARIFKQNNLLQGLETLRATGTAATTAGVGVSGGAVQGAVSTPGAGPIVVGSILAAVAAFAPAIGAAVAGAVTGTVGGLGIIGGILAATRSPVVRSAWAEFAAHAKEQFFAIGDAFVGPIQAGLAIIDRDLQSIDLKGVFAIAAPYVETLAAGLGSMVKEFIPGFREALSRAGPYVAVFSKGLGSIGKALGDFLAILSESKGGLEGLKFLFGAITGTIYGFANILRWLGDTFHWFQDRISDTLGVLANIAGWLGHTEWAKSIRETKANLDNVLNSSEDLTMSNLKLGDSFATTTSAAEEYAKALMDGEKAQSDYLNQLTGMEDASLAVAKGFLDLKDNLVAGKNNWDENTKAGNANLQMINDQVKLINAKRDADIAAANGNVQAIDAVNREYNAEIDQLIAVAKHAQATKAELDKLNGMHIQIIADIVIRNQLNKANAVDKALQGRASGGDLVPGQPYLFGEQGPEIGVFGSSGYMFNATSSEQMMKQWSGSGGGNTPPVVISFAASGDQFVDSLVKQLRKYVRVNGGAALVTN